MKKLYIVNGTSPYDDADYRENGEKLLSARTVLNEDGVGMLYIKTQYDCGDVHFYGPRLDNLPVSCGTAVEVSDACYARFEGTLREEIIEHYLIRVSTTAKQNAYHEMYPSPEVIDYSEEDIDDEAVEMLLHGWTVDEFNRRYDAKNYDPNYHNPCWPFIEDEELPF